MTDTSFDIHSVLLLIGPSMSGKTFCAKNHLIPKLTEALKTGGVPHPNITYISSDECRRELLGENSHKYDQRMLHASEKAFKLLHTKIDMAMQWPHNAHFVIVDTTGLSESFRLQVVAQAKASQYNVAAVIFDYKDTDEYLKFVPPEEQNKKLLFNHLERLHKDVWRSMKKNAYDQVIRIRNKDFDSLTFGISGIEQYAKSFIPNGMIYDICGDLHGCLDELTDLLNRRGYTIDYTLDPNGKITPPQGRMLILAGDIIDKGPHVEKVLNLVRANLHEPWFRIVWGNHENFVLKYVKGDLPDATDAMQHFSSAQRANIDPAFKDFVLTSLEDIRASATEFVQNDNLIVTHAPCEAKFLGKMDSFSLKQQRGQYRRPRRVEGQSVEDYVKSLEQKFSFIKDEATFNMPFRVFGHFSTKRGIRVKNQIGVDTDCVAGNALTMVTLGDRGVKFLRVPSLQPVTEEQVDLWTTHERKEIDIGMLDPKEFGRVLWTARNKVVFISGTMAPVEADEKTMELEPLRNAFEYYAKHGVQSVVVQPKYMGSRCNVYLSKNLDECYATSRNGFVIKPEQVDLKPVFRALQERFSKLESHRLLVLDGELMPWHALGAGLINDLFKVVGTGVESELNLLQQTGFESLLANAMDEKKSNGFDEAKGETSKENLAKQFGQHKAHTYRCLDQVAWHSLDEHRQALEVYKQQIRIYGQPGQPEFKPFGLLKVIRLEGNEGTDDEYQNVGASNEAQFTFLSDDAQLLVRLDGNQDEYQAEMKRAEDFFQELAANGMEGVVVKPSKVRTGIAPALKVRNPNYLSIIYGYDYRFPEKYERLVKTKRVRRKVEMSINEFKLGQEMLEIPYNEIKEDNKKYLQLVAAMVTEEQHEKELDPRL